MTRTRVRSARSQRGVALLVLAVLLVLGITWFLVSGLNAATQRTVRQRVDNAEALAEAKTAIIGRMVTDASSSSERNPGRLPCPEAKEYIGTPECEGRAAPGLCQKKDGTWLSAPTCDAVGRLPWRTLGLPKLLDASGEPLWYVVSPGWALSSSTSALTINSDSIGKLTVDNRPNAAVALVIAPGGPVTTAGSTACSARTQQRGVTPVDLCNYVEVPLDLTVDESATPVPTPTFTTFGAVGTFNDQLLTIATTDVIPPLEAAITARMQRDFAPALADAAVKLGKDLAPASLLDAGMNTVNTSVYPLASAWGDPSAATFIGTAGASSGRLPLVRSRKACSAVVTDPTYDPSCDLRPRKSCSTTVSDPAFDPKCDPIQLTVPLLSVPCTPGTDPQCILSTAVTWPIPPFSGNPSESVTKNPLQEWTVTWSNGLEYYRVAFAVDPSYPNSVRIGEVDRCGIGFSTTAQISCRVKYGQKCGGGCGGESSIDIIVTARTSTSAGKAFRRANPALLGSMYNAVHPSNSVTMQADGSAVVTTVWRPTPIPASCNEADCMTTRITLPALYIEDNIDFQSALRDAPTTYKELRWVINSNWHQLAYFAVSPVQVWSTGASPCAGTDCLSVSANSTTTLQQALLVLAGRALAGQDHAHPGSALGQYFEGANAVADKSFEIRTVNRGFNDRVVRIAPGP